ncbi:hypothetical protein OE88DRAFT_1738460 [Heliocybe sulcata]|uniref:Uncharacterized protein n=1 Tax=Heliocybe sulcata TaxID=5364 RepID=A0A5C3MUS0_9AGAM|nr:hypothetical protein OE88DRAFT_1738460 [Heliocybe sulcata]
MSSVSQEFPANSFGLFHGSVMPSFMQDVFAGMPSGGEAYPSMPTQTAWVSMENMGNVFDVPGWESHNRAQEERLAQQSTQIEQMEHELGEQKRKVAELEVVHAHMKPRKVKDCKLQITVKNSCLKLIGYLNKFKCIDGRKYQDLPDPLGDNDEPRTTPNNTRLWNPVWHLPVDTGVNDDFVIAVIALILQDAADYALEGCSLNERHIRNAIRTYFHTMQKNYRALKDKTERQKRVKKNSHNSRFNRKTRKCARLRRVIPRFRRIHGETSTVSIELIVETDLMLEEASSCGEADLDEWNTWRTEQRADPDGLEVRDLVWHAEEIKRILFALHKLARDFPHDEGCDADVEPDSDAEGDAEEDEDKDQDVGQASGSALGSRMKPRFYGCADKNRLPLRGKKAPFKNCISTGWASSTGNDKLQNSLKDVPDGLTIFQLKVSDEHLDERYVKHLQESSM